MGRKFEIKENSVVDPCAMTLGGVILGATGAGGLVSKIMGIAHKMYDTMVANPGIDYLGGMKVIDSGDWAGITLSGLAIVFGGALAGAAFSHEKYTISEVSPEHTNSPADGGLEKVSVFYKPGK